MPRAQSSLVQRDEQDAFAVADLLVEDTAAGGAYLDAPPGSPSRAKTVTARLAKGIQVLVPKGVCDGFQFSPGVTQYLSTALTRNGARA
jgi:hypothetical protein